MLPVSAHSRQLGLPVTPRPQTTSRLVNGSSHNVSTPGPLPKPSVHSRTRHLPSATSRGARSRSQPPRVISSPRHGRSASQTPRAYEENDIYNSFSRDHGQIHAWQYLPTSSDGTNSEDFRRQQPPQSRIQPIGTPNIVPETSKTAIDEPSGDGHAIWNAVSSAASALTISVSKAWASNVKTFSGEETPPGQESRLTRAMKAYYIAKARDSSDLPHWLFDEWERRADNSPGRPGHSREIRVQAPLPLQNRIRADTGSGEQVIVVSASPELATVRSDLQGTDRLKAMRMVNREIGARDLTAVPERDNRQASLDVPRALVRAPRIGLPSGPQRGRR